MTGIMLERLANVQEMLKLPLVEDRLMDGVDVTGWSQNKRFGFARLKIYTHRLALGTTNNAVIHTQTQYISGGETRNVNKSPAPYSGRKRVQP